MIRYSDTSTSSNRANLNGNTTSISGFPTWVDGATRVESNTANVETYYRFNPPQNFNTGGLNSGNSYVFQTYISGSGSVTYRSQYKIEGDTAWKNIPEPLSTLVMTPNPQKLIQKITVPISTRDYYVSLGLLTHGQGKYFLFEQTSMYKGSELYPWSPAPEDLTNGKSSGYFIATKSSDEFNFNDFALYNLKEEYKWLY